MEHKEEGLKKDVKDLLEKVLVRREYLERVKAMLDHKLATKFSAFDFLSNIDEEGMSKILAQLLDPKGNHAQGDIYLRLFLQTLNEKYNDFFEDLSEEEKGNQDSGHIPLSFFPTDKLATANVRTETSTDTGRRIDVTVQAGEFMFGIENKIGAAEPARPRMPHNLPCAERKVPEQPAIFTYNLAQCRCIL